LGTIFLRPVIKVQAWISSAFPSPFDGRGIKGEGEGMQEET